MENNTIVYGTQVKTTRVVYAGNTPHALTVKNLTKLDVGSEGKIIASYEDEVRNNTTVYVVKFLVGDTYVFAYMSDSSFL